MGSWQSLRPTLALLLMPIMAITVIPHTTVDMVDTMVATTDMAVPMDMATVTSARGQLMLNPRLMLHPRLTLPLMPGMAITVIPDTTDTAVDTMGDMPAATTDTDTADTTVDTTDTPTDMALTTAVIGVKF